MPSKKKQPKPSAQQVLCAIADEAQRRKQALAEEARCALERDAEKELADLLERFWEEAEKAAREGGRYLSVGTVMDGHPIRARAFELLQEHLARPENQIPLTGTRARPHADAMHDRTEWVATW